MDFLVMNQHVAERYNRHLSEHRKLSQLDEYGNDVYALLSLVSRECGGLLPTEHAMSLKHTLKGLAPAQQWVEDMERQLEGTLKVLPARSLAPLLDERRPPSHRLIIIRLLGRAKEKA